MALTQINPALFAGSSNTTAVIQSNGTTAVTVDSSQNVGIGTASPLAILDVASSSNPAVRIRNTSTGGAGIWFANSTSGTTTGDGSNVGIDSSQQLNLWNYENTATLLATNNTERARISSSGQFMVGTTTSVPSVLFESRASAVGMTAGTTGKLVTSLQISFAAGTSTKNIRLQLGDGLQYAAEITLLGTYGNFNASGAIKYVYAGNVNTVSTTIYGAGQQSLYSLGSTSSWYSFGTQSKPSNGIIYFPITGTSLSGTDTLCVVVEITGNPLSAMSATIDYV